MKRVPVFSFHIQVNNRKRAAPKGTVRQREESTDSVEPPPTYCSTPLVVLLDEM